jgi:hypothetical protein
MARFPEGGRSDFAYRRTIQVGLTFNSRKPIILYSEIHFHNVKIPYGQGR